MRLVTLAAVMFHSRAVRCAAPLNQAVGVVLGDHQSSADQIADRGLNFVDAVQQAVRKAWRVEPALGVRCVENLVLELG